MLTFCNDPALARVSAWPTDIDGVVSAVIISAVSAETEPAWMPVQQAMCVPPCVQHRRAEAGHLCSSGMAFPLEEARETSKTLPPSPPKWGVVCASSWKKP